jgi:fission process protein 1
MAASAAGLDSNKGNNEKACNVFRDSPVRFLGYANEVGESFRYQFPRFVTPSYVLAFGYCFMDAASTGYDTWNSHNDRKTSRSREINTIVATSDTLLWQTLASVMIPGATINLIVKATRAVVPRLPGLPVVAATWMPTAVGLSSIPFIVHPIDSSVDFLMDHTVREWVVDVIG